MALLCIVASQRAGTTALQSALGRSGSFLNLSEIFQTNESRRAGNFLDYARELRINVADLATFADARRVCEEYLDHIEAMDPDRVPVIDVKFNAWYAIHPFWAYPQAEPLLMQVLKQRGASFVFVRRRDLASQVLSEEIARHTGVWHDLDDEVPLECFAVNLGAVRAKARQIVLAEKFFAGRLAQYPLCRRVAYEDMFDGDFVDPALAEFCLSSVGIEEPVKLRPSIAKNAGDKAGQITNHAEAVEAIEDVARRLGRSVH